MRIKTYGDPYGSYYRLQEGDTDVPRKKKVNFYYTTSATKTEDNTPWSDAWLRWNLVNIAQVDVAYIPGQVRSEAFCRNAIIAKLRGYMDEALLLADLIYAKSTFQTALARGKQLLAMTRALKRRDVRAIKRYFSKTKRVDRLGEVPAAWLEWQFVYNPLRATIKTAAEHIDNPSLRREIDIRSPENTITNRAWNGENFFVSQHLTTRCAYKGTIICDNPNANFIHRMGMADVLATVYDIVPWTWAVDYFSNVGHMLGNLNPKYDAFDFVDSFWSYKVTGFIAENFRVWQRPPYEKVYRRATFERYVRFVGQPGNVSLELEFDLNIGQFANLMSAISLTLKGKFR